MRATAAWGAPAAAAVDVAMLPGSRPGNTSISCCRHDMICSGPCHSEVTCIAAMGKSNQLYVLRGSCCSYHEKHGQLFVHLCSPVEEDGSVRCQHRQHERELLHAKQELLWLSSCRCDMQSCDAQLLLAVRFMRKLLSHFRQRMGSMHFTCAVNLQRKMGWLDASPAGSCFCGPR